MKILVAVILALLGSPKHVHTASCKHVKRAHALAQEIMRAVEVEARGQDEPMDPVIVAAVRFRESSFRDRVVGKLGEVGAMQIKRDGRATIVCASILDRIDRVSYNLLCGIRLLRQARDRCGGPPENWLGFYNGLGCGSSAYAGKILATLP